MNQRTVIVAASILCVCLPSSAGTSLAGERFETRCGWFENPTPANVSLYDRDGEWIIGIQGDYQVEGDWPWPDFKAKNWVKTNNDYGYGCACLELQVDPATHHVLAIRTFTVKPLASCRRDPALAKWGRQFK